MVKTPTNVEDAVRTANLSCPILLAEIASGRNNLIHGNHRVAKARLDNLRLLKGWRVRCPEHFAFITSTIAYGEYVEYWNGKVKQLQRRA